MSKPRKHKGGCPLADAFHPDYGKLRKCECFKPKFVPGDPVSGHKFLPSLDEYDGMPRGGGRKL